MKKLDQKKHTNKSTSATGPRTAAGKERSKRNAVKHGIFSSLVVLPNEPWSEFDSMFRALHDDFQPKGAFEQSLVEQIAVFRWRLRRVLLAEVAEIQNGADFLEWDKGELVKTDAHEVYKRSYEYFGLITRIANPIVLRCCLELLEALECSFRESGFESELVKDILSRLYVRPDRVSWSLFDTYIMWSSHAACPEQERKEKGLPSSVGCRNEFLAAVEEEKRRLIRYHEERTRIESERTRLESLRRNVPSALEVDHLVKYEAHLERCVDRTLTQLERRQRMRVDQPLMPPIKADVSSS